MLQSVVDTAIAVREMVTMVILTQTGTELTTVHFKLASVKLTVHSTTELFRISTLQAKTVLCW